MGSRRFLRIWTVLMWRAARRGWVVLDWICGGGAAAVNVAPQL